jgi:lysophospholipase L1-like esterase
VFQRLVKMKVEYMRKREKRVSYIDPDCMKEHMYRVDGVHLNNEGAEVFGQKVRHWVQASCVGSRE